MRRTHIRRAQSILLMCSCFFLVVSWGRAQTVETNQPLDDGRDAQIEAKQNELHVLQQKLQALRTTQAQKKAEGKSITSRIDELESRIEETQLQLDLTNVSTDEVRLQLQSNRTHITQLADRENRLHEELLKMFREIDVYDQRSVLETLLSQESFSAFLQTAHAYQSLQQKATSLLNVIQDAKKARQAKEADLRYRQQELEDLQKLQQTQKQSLQHDTDTKRHLLSQNVAEQAKVSSQIAEAEQARQEVQAAIFTLRNVGIQLSFSDATSNAAYASKLTGVRPALLLGVLKVESNIGNNVGSGRYKTDMNPLQHDAFLRITNDLGLNPDTTPVSAKPTSYAGWGGAMGPGQIMPTTWEAIASTVGRLTGNPRPSPFTLHDAFVGTAVILQGAGASDGREYEAVNRYFAGPNWQRFTWYGDRVLAVAKIYEQQGL